MYTQGTLIYTIYLSHSTQVAGVTIFRKHAVFSSKTNLILCILINFDFCDKNFETGEEQNKNFSLEKTIFAQI